MWSDAADAIMADDQVLALAYVTPAKGVVIAPVTNFGLHERERATISSVNSSAGAYRKLERIRANPRVALAFHTREHGFGNRPEYVLVHGRATLAEPDPRYAETIHDSWVRYAGAPLERGLWGWWLRAFHKRVQVDVEVERVVVWPDLACSGEPAVFGAPLPEAPPPPQKPPRNGTGPRIDHRRAARRAQRLPHVLLGWVGADGFPMVVPVVPQTADERGITLKSAVPLPPGGRRAGLTAHWFAKHVVGQRQRIHTGWLDGGVYAPHTQFGYAFPASRNLFRLFSGGATRWEARQAGAAASAGSSA